MNMAIGFIRHQMAYPLGKRLNVAYAKTSILPGNWLWVSIFLILNMADVVTTGIGISMGGREVAPLVTLAGFSMTMFMWFKVLLVGIVAYAVLRRGNVNFTRYLCVPVAFAVGNNLHQILSVYRG